MVRQKKTVKFSNPDVSMDIEVGGDDDPPPRYNLRSKSSGSKDSDLSVGQLFKKSVAATRAAKAGSPPAAAVAKAVKTGAPLGKNATQAVAKTVAKGAAKAAAATSGVAKDAIADQTAKAAAKWQQQQPRQGQSSKWQRPQRQQQRRQ